MMYVKKKCTSNKRTYALAWFGLLLTHHPISCVSAWDVVHTWYAKAPSRKEFTHAMLNRYVLLGGTLAIAAIIAGLWLNKRARAQQPAQQPVPEAARAVRQPGVTIPAKQPAPTGVPASGVPSVPTAPPSAPLARVPGPGTTGPSGPLVPTVLPGQASQASGAHHPSYAPGGPRVSGAQISAELEQRQEQVTGDEALAQQLEEVKKVEEKRRGNHPGTSRQLTEPSIPALQHQVPIPTSPAQLDEMWEQHATTQSLITAYTEEAKRKDEENKQKAEREEKRQKEQAAQQLRAAQERHNRALTAIENRLQKPLKDCVPSDIFAALDKLYNQYIIPTQETDRSFLAYLVQQNVETYRAVRVTPTDYGQTLLPTLKQYEKAKASRVMKMVCTSLQAEKAIREKANEAQNSDHQVMIVILIGQLLNIFTCQTQ